ncbi:hypothetical protein [Bradyrhizobium sp. 23AC]
MGSDHTPTLRRYESLVREVIPEPDPFTDLAFVLDALMSAPSASSPMSIKLTHDTAKAATQ